MSLKSLIPILGYNQLDSNDLGAYPNLHRERSAISRQRSAKLPVVEDFRADRIFDCVRQPDPAASGARSRANSAVGCTWTSSLEEGWGSGGRGECRSGQLLNHNDDELAPNPSQAPRGSESGRSGAFTSAGALSGGPREHDAGYRDHRKTLWALLVFQLWARRHGYS